MVVVGPLSTHRFISSLNTRVQIGEPIAVGSSGQVYAGKFAGKNGSGNARASVALASDSLMVWVLSAFSRLKVSDHISFCPIRHSSRDQRAAVDYV